MSFSIKTNVIFPGLIHLHFKSQYEVTSTMLRLQEFYESPYEHIRGNSFTIEEYMDTYARAMGNFTYTIDWSGFNVPGKVVNEFFGVFSTDELLAKEITLRNTILKAKEDIGIWDDKDPMYYVIASYDDDTEGMGVLKHEIAHGMWYLNKEYRTEMENIIGKFPKDNLYELLADRLLDKGYTTSVLTDEIQAYFATSDMLQLCEDFDMEGLSWGLPWGAVLECKKVFEKYYKEIEDYQS